MDKFITRKKIAHVQTSNEMEVVAEERRVTVEVHRDFDGNVCMTPSLRVNQQEIPAMAMMAASARKRRYQYNILLHNNYFYFLIWVCSSNVKMRSRSTNKVNFFVFIMFST